MASVSRAARVSRIGFTCNIRRTYAPTCASVRSCQRPPRSVSATPESPGGYRALRPSRATSSCSREKWVVSCNAFRSSGFSATKRSASTTACTRAGEAKRAASARSCRSSWAAFASSSSSESAAAPASAGKSSPVVSAPLSVPGTGAPFSAAVARAPVSGASAAAAPAASPAMPVSGRSASVVKHGSFFGSREQPVRAREVDLPVPVGLVHAHQLEPGHLQDGEEGGHHPVPVHLRQILEHRAEGDARLAAETIRDGGDAVADGESLDEHLVRDLDLAVLEDPRERLDQAIHRQLRRPQVGDLVRRERQLLLGAPDEDVAPELRMQGELLRGVPVLLVLEQPPHQLFARIGAWFPLLLLRRLVG